MEPATPTAEPDHVGRAAFLRGLRTLPLIPSLILLSGMVGFGALARESGFGLGQAVGISAFVWALPGQVMLVDQLGRGNSYLVAFLAVTLTSIRLLPMAVVLAPLLRGDGLKGWGRRIGLGIAAHFVALTLWIEGQRVLPTLPRDERLPLFLGWCVAFFPLSLIATAIGYSLAGQVPARVSAVLLFLTPLYFGLSMVAAARAHRSDAIAVVVGAVLGPVLHFMVPSLDLLIVGCTAALVFMLAERRGGAAS